MTEYYNSTPKTKQQIDFNLETNISEVTKSVKWSLANFQSYMGSVGSYIDSKTFTTYFDGKKVDWFLRLYPFGFDKIYEPEQLSLFLEPGELSLFLEPGQLSLFLKCNSELNTTRIRFAILDETNTERCIHKLEGTWTKGCLIGVEFFVERYKLLAVNSTLLVNGSLTISCAITTNEVKNLERVQASSSRETVARLASDFGDLLKTSKLSDLRLIAGDGKEFRAHRYILAARSPVFSAMFEHEFKEKSSGRVNIPDIGPKTMDYLLNFIYTGECRGDIKDVAEDLLQASNKYQLNDLKEICSNYLSAQIKNDNAASLLALAELYNATDLKARVLDFVVYNFKAVTISEEWKNLSATNPCLVLEVKDRVIEKLNCL